MLKMEVQIDTVVKVPEYDSNNIQMYIEELMMWMLIMSVEKKKQGPIVWMSLPKNDPNNIKQFISNSIKNKDLNKDDCIEKLVAI